MSLFSHKKIIMPGNETNTGPVLVAGASGFFCWSEDLETFTPTEQYLPGFEWLWYCMCNKHDEGIVAFSNYALAMASKDGKSWTPQNEMNMSNPIATPFACLRNQNGYILVGRGQNSLQNKGAVVQVNTDFQITGSSGIHISSTGSGYVTGIQFSPALNQYIIAGRQGTSGFIGYSADGLSYGFPSTHLKPINSLAINEAGTKGVAVTVNAGGILYACNFSSQTWIPVVPDAKVINWQGLAYYDGKYAACSSDGYVTVSTDGVTFSTPVKVSTAATRVFCFDGLWVITGNNHILVSDDAYAWSEISIPGLMYSAAVIGSFAG